MLQNYTDVINLFRILALKDDKVKSFFVGEDKRLLEGSRSSEIYPYVWVEYADGRGLDNGGGALSALYDCRIFIAGSAGLGDDPGEEKVLQITEDILFRLLLRLRSLKLKRKIIFELDNTKWMRVKIAQIDNNFGWELLLQVGDYRESLCINESEERAVAIIQPICGEAGPAADLTLTILAESQGDYAGDFAGADYQTTDGEVGKEYSVKWSGGCGNDLKRALNELANTINSDSEAVATAESWGDCLFLRSKFPRESIGLDLTGGAYGWLTKHENL